MVFVWAKQETVLAVFKKCPLCLVYVRQYANVFSVGPCLYCINREDRRYTKKMTLANKSAIFMHFSHRLFTLSVRSDLGSVLCFQYMLAFYIFQHGHLLYGYLVEFLEAFSLWQTFIDKDCVQVLHITQAN